MTINPLAQQGVSSKATRSDVGAKYRAIEEALIAGQDHVTIGQGQDELPITILATGGEHPAFRAKSENDVRYRTIVTQEGGYPGKTYLVTYQLGSADGIDNMLHITSVEANPDWGAPDGSAPATTQTLFGMW